LPPDLSTNQPTIHPQIHPYPTAREIYHLFFFFFGGDVEGEGDEAERCGL
jgi:hypothetical protein